MQFIVPRPHHVYDSLIQKQCAMEPRKFLCLLSVLLARGLFKISFYDGMFCVGIAATGMNRFKGHGSLNNFASVTQGFLLQHPFQTSLSNLVLGTVVHKPSNPSR